jgi:hypothetical protein
MATTTSAPRRKANPLAIGQSTARRIVKIIPRLHMPGNTQQAALNNAKEAAALQLPKTIRQIVQLGTQMIGLIK